MADTITNLSQFVGEVSYSDPPPIKMTKLSQFVVEVATPDVIVVQTTKVSQVVGEVAYKASPQYADLDKYITLEYLIICEIEPIDFDAELELSVNLVGENQTLEGDFDATIELGSSLTALAFARGVSNLDSTIILSDNLEIKVYTAAIFSDTLVLSDKLSFAGYSEDVDLHNFSTTLVLSNHLILEGRTAATFDSTLVLGDKLEVAAVATIPSNSNFDTTLVLSNSLVIEASASGIKLINFDATLLLSSKLVVDTNSTFVSYFDSTFALGDRLELVASSYSYLVRLDSFDSILTLSSILVLAGEGSETTVEEGDATIELAVKLLLDAYSEEVEEATPLLKYYGGCYGAADFIVERRLHLNATAI